MIAGSEMLFTVGQLPLALTWLARLTYIFDSPMQYHMCYYQSTYVPTLDVHIVRRQKKHKTILKTNYVTSGSHKTYVHEFKPLFFKEISQKNL